jgi:hypothetical protein
MILKVSVMRAYGAVKLRLHKFLTTVIYGGEVTPAKDPPVLCQSVTYVCYKYL